MNKQELEALYGPEAPYSEHKRGAHITFNDGEQVYTGTILWVCKLRERVELSRPIKHIGMKQPAIYINYIVRVDNQTSFPRVVWPGDIIEMG